MVPERAYRVNFFFCWALLLGSCAPKLHDGVFRKGDLVYRVGEVPQGFRAVSLKDNDVAFVGIQTPHSIAVNATCAEHGDPSLEVLTQHLLMGFSDRETVEQVPGTLDGRESLRSRWNAKLDGVPIELLLVVMKKDGCVYDLSYLSPPGRFDEQRAAFEALLQRFHTERR